ncbi:MAG: hypothetical protein E6J99_00365 [Methanobacteriota archaeon]|nr:MAG: hypothetical protein E6J99_00365 [Euryarchaeota archaeon]
MSLSDRFGTSRAVHGSMLFLVLVWGLAFVAIKQALGYMSWITLTFLRFVVADLLFVGSLAARRQLRPAPSRADLPRLTLLAFVGFTGYHLFLNLGETDPTVTAGTAALIIASTPAFIAVLSIPLLKEKIRPLQAAAIALAFAGLGLMISFAHPGSQFRFQASQGALTVIPSAIFSALYAVFGKRSLVRYPPATLITWTLLIGTVLLLPLIALTFPEFVRDLTTMGISGWLPVLFLALLPTFLGPLPQRGLLVRDRLLAGDEFGLPVLERTALALELLVDPRRSIASNTSAAHPSWAIVERSGRRDRGNHSNAATFGPGATCGAAFKSARWWKMRCHAPSPKDSMWLNFGTTDARPACVVAILLAASSGCSR